MEIVITLSIGLLGALLLKLFKLPGAIMVGSALFVALAQLIHFEARVPGSLRGLAQLISGMVIGLNIGKRDLLSIPRLWKGFFVLMIGFLITNILVGFTISALTDIDPLTAYFGGVPGGISFMPLLASEYGADPAVVGVLGIFRLFAGVSIFPILVHKFNKKVSLLQANRSRVSGPEEANRISRENLQAKEEEVQVADKQGAPFLVFFIIISACALLARQLSDIFSIMVYSMLISIAFNLMIGVERPPLWSKRLAQWISGSYIGASFGMEKWMALSDLLLPILILLCYYGLACLFIGFMVNKVQKIPLEDGCFAAIPAGASDIALITEELGIHNPTISIYHALRASLVSSLFPLIILELITAFYR